MSAVTPADDLIARARGGDKAARDELIEQHRQYVAQVASACCHRALQWENDDELSVGLIAFNDAIDNYNPERGASFHTYAGKVIRHRLIDHFRREGRDRHLHLEEGGDDEDDVRASLDVTVARERHQTELERADRVEEIHAFEETLESYGVDLFALARASPKHRDTRETLMRAAHALAGSPELLDYLHRHRQLPMKDLQIRTGISRKVLDAGRKYIIALTLILSHPGWDHLRTHIKLTAGPEAPAPGAGEKR